MTCHVSHTWLAMCHTHGLPCATHMACHVSYMHRPFPCNVTHGLPCVTHMVFHVSPTWLVMCRPTPTSKYVKFRLPRNPTKFDWVARFRETIPTVQSVSLSEILKNLNFSPDYFGNIFLPPLSLFFFFLKNLNLKFSRVLHAPPLKITSSRNFCIHTHSNTCICNSHLKCY